ncbi:MAG: DUF1801 domain-containing protein [Ignavibacteriales bacterium]|nr:DUF1801 domain-containing protein [Ignavibacteriales bacterium]
MSPRRRFETIDAYVGTFPKKSQSLLRAVRRIIRQTVPESEETISYQIPAFKLNGRILVYFAGFKNHISVYPFSAEMGRSIQGASRYETSGKGTIRFPLDQPLPAGLIQKIVKYRMKNSLERERSKTKRNQ